MTFFCPVLEEQLKNQSHETDLQKDLVGFEQELEDLESTLEKTIAEEFSVQHGIEMELSFDSQQIENLEKQLEQLAEGHSNVCCSLIV